MTLTGYRTYGMTYVCEPFQSRGQDNVEELIYLLTQSNSNSFPFSFFLRSNFRYTSALPVYWYSYPRLENEREALIEYGSDFFLPVGIIIGMKENEKKACKLNSIQDIQLIMTQTPFQCRSV